MSCSLTVMETAGTLQSSRYGLAATAVLAATARLQELACNSCASYSNTHSCIGKSNICIGNSSSCAMLCRAVPECPTVLTVLCCTVLCCSTRSGWMLAACPRGSGTAPQAAHALFDLRAHFWLSESCMYYATAVVRLYGLG